MCCNDSASERRCNLLSNIARFDQFLRQRHLLILPVRAAVCLLPTQLLDVSSPHFPFTPDDIQLLQTPKSQDCDGYSRTWSKERCPRLSEPRPWRTSRLITEKRWRVDFMQLVSSQTALTLVDVGQWMMHRVILSKGETLMQSRGLGKLLLNTQ